jgi:hypothetical protein
MAICVLFIHSDTFIISIAKQYYVDKNILPNKKQEKKLYLRAKLIIIKFFSSYFN